MRDEYLEPKAGRGGDRRGPRLVLSCAVPPGPTLRVVWLERIERIQEIVLGVLRKASWFRARLQMAYGPRVVGIGWRGCYICLLLSGEW